jgi:hypothetical protein
VERRKLNDILHREEAANIAKLWESTEAAADLAPLPPGTYKCRLTDGGPFQAKSGTPGYKLIFAVVEGEHSGRKCFHELWLTEAALPLAKRDLQKLGVSRLEQLDRPPPQGIIAEVRLALRKNDSGDEFNIVKRFDVIDIEKPEPPDPYAPKTEGGTNAAF